MDDTAFDSPMLPSTEELEKILFKDGFLSSPLHVSATTSSSQKCPQILHNSQDLFTNIELGDYVVAAPLTPEPTNQPAFEDRLRPSNAPRGPLGPPDQTPFPGRYNFSASLICSSNNSKLLYSSALNKMYTDINVDLPINFYWDSDRHHVVRARIVFTDPGHAQKQVFACKQHCLPIAEQHIALNILHSSSSLGTQGVRYEGQVDNPDSWLSVVVEFPPGASRKHVYRSICKNSCATGINRRATGILFTLEELDGTVVGQHLLHARFCSCPPRDRKKDEKDTPKRRAPPAPRALPAKRPKPEPGDALHLASVLTPQATVLPRAMLAGWETMVRITQVAAESCTDQARREELNDSLRMLQEQIDELKENFDIS